MAKVKWVYVLAKRKWKQKTNAFTFAESSCYKEFALAEKPSNNKFFSFFLEFRIATEVLCLKKTPHYPNRRNVLT